ncbi:hypothetical protein [Microbacterium sp. 179-I 3D3 NHS]|uniref:hypothetical protein n=1 Tax=Microbacterium sp. 179-I 3D3 NHS TaxID=3142382 RepID=UPI0039A238B4
MTDPADAEEFTLLHRMNFWGRTEDDLPPGTLSWEYGRQRWRARRPPDGRPPSEVDVRCAHCYETLTFRVQSRAAMRRRKLVLRVTALVLTLLVVLAIVSCSQLVGIADDSALPDAARASAAAGAVLSIVLLALCTTGAWALALAAVNQVGVSGNGAGLPGFTRHRVQAHEPSSTA